MDNLPTTNLPAATPQLTQSLSPEACDAHRKKIALEVEIILQGYWQTQLSPQMKGAVLADWSDELEDWPINDIRWGLRKWRTDFPNKKPNPVHVSDILKNAWGIEVVKSIPKQTTPEPERVVSEEQKATADELTARYAKLAKNTR